MKKKDKDNQGGFTEDQAIARMAELVLSNAVEARNQAVDPFEEYAFGLQVKVFDNVGTFTNRCVLGYQTLLQYAETQKTKTQRCRDAERRSHGQTPEI